MLTKSIKNTLEQMFQLVIEPFAIANKRQLPKNNPLRVLLDPTLREVF